MPKLQTIQSQRIDILVDHLAQFVGTLPADFDDQFGNARPVLVESSPLGRMMGNLYLRVASAGIPMQLFVEETRAVEWLIAQRR